MTCLDRPTLRDAGAAPSPAQARRAHEARREHAHGRPNIRVALPNIRVESPNSRVVKYPRRQISESSNIRVAKYQSCQISESRCFASSPTRLGAMVAASCRRRRRRRRRGHGAAGSDKCWQARRARKISFITHKYVSSHISIFHHTLVSFITHKYLSSRTSAGKRGEHDVLRIP